MRSYAIGDVHGHLDLLIHAQALVAADRAATGDATAPLVHLGDLVDRGPDSRGVVQHMMAGQAQGLPWVVLKGNHDRMFTLYLDDLPDRRLRADLSWLHPRLGGAATLESYGVRSPADRPLAPVLAEARAAVPPAHKSWLATVPPLFIVFKNLPSMHDSHAKKQKYFHHFYLCRHIYVVKLLNSILVSSSHSAYTVPEILIINTHYNKKENMMASQDSSFNCKFCG